MPPPYTPRELMGRHALSGFTPERPMMVSKVMMAALKREPALADMMDRVREYGTLPLDANKGE